MAESLNQSYSKLRNRVNLKFTQNTFTYLTFILLLLSVVIPNSLQKLTAVVMVICFTLSIKITKFNADLVKLGYLYVFGVFVTLFYLIVGVLNGAPNLAVQQIVVVNILSPLLWMGICAGLVQTVGAEKLVRWFVFFSVLSCLTIVLYFYLFINFGPDAVTFFKEDGNVSFGEGNAAAIMFVYGSLIFICGGFFSTPGLIANPVYRGAFLGMLALAAVTSGRSALVLSIPLGLLMGWLLSSSARVFVSSQVRVRGFRNFLIILVIALPVVYGVSNYFDIDITKIFDGFTTELLSGGGSERAEETLALLNGSISNYLLGAGHGIGVAYSRNAEFPWRYETVWVATLFRVGIIGSMIYLLPFIWYTKKIVGLARLHELPNEQKFMFSGFVCVFVATNTNPYIESFVFQWMYVLPIVALLALPTVAARNPLK